MYQENSQPVRQSTPLDYQMGPPIETMEQINDKLITASRGGGVITIPTPNLKEKTFFVLVKDEVGNPIVVKDETGKVFEKTVFLVQDEENPWLQQEIPVPDEELFDTTFVTSVLGDLDQQCLASLCDSYFFGIVVQAVAKRNMAYDLYHIKKNIHSITHINKAKEGETLHMVKTTITKGESLANWTMKQAMLDEQKKKMFGFLPNFGNK